MKKLVVVAAVLWAAQAFAQTPASSPAPAVSGTITSGIQQFDNTTNSSKLTEYRNLRDDFYVPGIGLSANDIRTGWFFDVSGRNVTRDDQTILAAGGRPGVWDVRAEWIGIPHNSSHKAVTPFIRQAPGLFEVPATVPITFKKLATSTPNNLSLVDRSVFENRRSAPVRFAATISAIS